MATTTRLEKSYSSIETAKGAQDNPLNTSDGIQNNRVLLSYEEIPEWYKDNEFIHGGYRPVSFSTPACFASWLYLHNETVNIYSHLIPSMFFATAELAMYIYIRSQYPEATAEDHLVFAFFLLTAVICLAFSAILHTLSSHSRGVCEYWLHLDFIGIIILTLGDFVSGIDMIFYCEPMLKRSYWIMVGDPSIMQRPWNILKHADIVSRLLRSVFLLSSYYSARNFKDHNGGPSVLVPLSQLVSQALSPSPMVSAYLASIK